MSKQEKDIYTDNGNVAENVNTTDEQAPDLKPLDGEEAVEDISELDSESQTESLEAEILRLNKELEEERKKYLLLYADFDNFRKRTVKEKSELIKNGGEQAFKGLLPILDDFERGIDACTTSGNDATCQGMQLILNKFQKYLVSNGVKEFGADDKEFDSDRHEAISVVPVTDPDQKGKIIDTVQKGYTINDKVLRHAKVVVGQ